MGHYHNHAIRTAERRQAAALERVAAAQVTDVERARREAYDLGFQAGHRAGHLAGWRTCWAAIHRAFPQLPPPPYPTSQPAPIQRTTTLVRLDQTPAVR